MFAHESATRAENPVWISRGTENFEYSGILVRPTAVLFDTETGRLVVVVRALSSDYNRPTTIDLCLARISAWVVSGSVRPALPHREVSLYLRFPDAADIMIAPNLTQTARWVATREEQLRRHGRTRWKERTPFIPGPALACVLSTSVEAACSTCRSIHGSNRYHPPKSATDGQLAR